MYWTVCVEGGSPRVYHASVVVGNCIYTFGGRYHGKISSPDKMEVHVLDAITLQSAAVTVVGEEAPPNFLGHTAVVLGRNVYVWGGYSSLPFRQVLNSTVWCFDTKAHRWTEIETTGHIPTPRVHHTACVINGSMFVIGGFERRFGFPMRVVHVLDLRTMLWSVFPTSDSSPQGGMYRSAVLTRAQDGCLPREGLRQICLFGGSTNRSLFPTGNDPRSLDLCVQESMRQLYGWNVAFLDAVSGMWLFGTSPPIPSLTGSSGFVYGNHLYMTVNKAMKSEQSGWLTRRCIEDNTLEEVLPGGAPREARCLGSCVVVREKVFFIGGVTSSVKDGAFHSAGTKSSNRRYTTLADHYGAVQVLDFRPNLRDRCCAIIAQNNLDSKELPFTLQQEVELFSPNNF